LSKNKDKYFSFIIEYVVCFDLKGEKWIRFENKECNFGYRESIFKHQEGNFIIWRVGFRLKKNFTPNIEYKDIKKAIENNNITSLSPSIIARLVKQIRKEKLPDYKVLGNVGSFFKNPIISNKHYAELVKVYPNIVAFDEKESKKISAAWLIEYCGYKGKRIGNVGMSSNQALIMVNYGGANGEEVLFLAKEIQEKVKQNFDINLEIEANII
ncbi:MAG: UDP-N-acetylenolpyruvoylglucosamine reductase, partial [Bacteroidota bacterium]|nr:UDP-N-acetylenolpyruvoylglucosamine reductase [Bacteroidota bacterium]